VIATAQEQEKIHAMNPDAGVTAADTSWHSGHLCKLVFQHQAADPFTPMTSRR